MTPIQETRLRLLKENIGPLSVDEALTLAIEAERIARDCGPADPAYSMFVAQHRGYFEYAELLELEAAQATSA